MCSCLMSEDYYQSRYVPTPISVVWGIIHPGFHGYTYWSSVEDIKKTLQTMLNDAQTNEAAFNKIIEQHTIDWKRLSYLQELELREQYQIPYHSPLINNEIALNDKIQKVNPYIRAIEIIDLDADGRDKVVFSNVQELIAKGFHKPGYSIYVLRRVRWLKGNGRWLKGNGRWLKSQDLLYTWSVHPQIPRDKAVGARLDDKEEPVH